VVQIACDLFVAGSFNKVVDAFHQIGPQPPDWQELEHWSKLEPWPWWWPGLKFLNKGMKLKLA
jgi:hypothetical protein